MVTFWMFEQSLYIVDFTNVYCASSFVCLLVELHINACITYQVIKIVMVGTGPSLRITKNSFPVKFPDGATTGFIFLSQMTV